MTTSTPGAAAPAADDIRDLFDRIAPMYDDFNQTLSWGFHRIWKLMTVQWSGAEVGHSCLDVCCGSGDLALLLAQHVGPAGQVYGVDFSAAQLEVARHKGVQHRGLAPLYWLQGDALALPFAPETFDAITMGYGLRNLVNISQGLQELYRVLKPGARAAVLDFNRPKTAWMQQFQQWYLESIVVATAQHYQLTEEYAYISPSVARFPSGAEQTSLGLAAGFSTAVHYPIAGGLMGVLVLTR